MVRRRIVYRGTVQGVGFRWTAVRTAEHYTVTGTVRNADDESVEVVVEGRLEDIEQFCAQLEERMAGYIESREVEESAATGKYGTFGVAY